MGKLKGELRTCDRCGKSQFFKLVHTGELDGGFTHTNKFEEAKGWDWLDGLDLCPECAKEWEKMKKKFVENTKNEDKTSFYDRQESTSY